MTATSALSASKRTTSKPLRPRTRPATWSRRCGPCRSRQAPRRTRIVPPCMRWVFARDPEGHRWHGTTTTDRVRGAARSGPDWSTGVRDAGAAAASDRRATPGPGSIAERSAGRRTRALSPARDGARTCLESRIALPDDDSDAEEIATPTRRFSLLEITTGLPDDSREADERAAERRLRELRARVRATRAVVATTPGLAETLHLDWRKTARFYAGFGITDALFRLGVPTSADPLEGGFTVVGMGLALDIGRAAEIREEVTLPV